MIAEVLRWWLAVEAAGLVVLPIVFVLFQRLPGRGLAFAKPAGLLLIGYVFWLALTLQVLPNRPGSIFWAALPFLIASGLILRHRWRELRTYAEENIGYILALEAVFLVSLLVAAYIKSFLPDIAGTEKPMDFMFLNAAHRSEFYPPRDPWLAGHGVSYYYFGYVINAMTGKIAALPTAVTFNLALAGTAALAATAAFGLGYEIARLAGATARAALNIGAGAILLLAVVGNLEGVLEWAIANDVVGPSINDTVKISNLETARPSNDCFLPGPGGCLIAYPSDQSSFWWWWRATRLSPDGNSITEFPFFSFILGDLHPHVMAIPFVLTAVALGLCFWAGRRLLDYHFWRRNPGLLLVSALLIGGLGFLNTWDLPTFGFVVAALVLLGNFVVARTTAGGAPAAAPAPGEGSDLWANTPVDEAAAAPPPTGQRGNSGVPLWLASSAGFLGPLLLLAVLLYVPFYVSFGSQAAGFATVVDGATQPLHSALFWGVLVTVNLPLPFVLLRQAGVRLRRQDAALAAGIPAALLLVWAAMTLLTRGVGSLPDAVAARGLNWFTWLFFGVLFGAAVLALRYSVVPAAAPSAVPATAATGRRRRVSPAPPPSPDSSPLPPPLETTALIPVLVLMSTGVLLILGAELFYVQDVFRSRLNTVFKLSYQAWLLLAISGAYSLWWLVNRWRPEPGSVSALLRSGWRAAAVLVLVGGLLYPLGATLARTQGLGAPFRTLDGLETARRTTPDDMAAIDWLRDRAGQHERIVEGTGGQYSASGRVAAYTGIPTVLGWLGHETQWGRDTGMLLKRESDVDLAYTTTQLDDALRILRQYDVTYVVVGTVERAKYPPAGLAKFNDGLPVVARFGQTVIYRVPRLAPGSGNADVP